MQRLAGVYPNLFGRFFIAWMAGLSALCCAAGVLGQQPAPTPPKTNPRRSSEIRADEPGPRPVQISWVGDIVMEVPWREQPTPPKALFDGVRQLLKNEDLAIANLETPLTAWPDQTPYKDKAAVEAGTDVVLRVTSPEAAPALADGGISVVGLANNHTMDFTENGLLETMERLRKAGVAFAGAGENLAAAESAFVAKVKGKRIAIVSFSDVVPRYSWAEADRPGIAPGKETERVVEALRRIRPKADILILLVHWGTQFVQEPTPRQLFLAEEAQKAGADLVLGAHPHVLQGVGCVRNVPVVYSAGNFIFPTMSLPTRRSAIFEFTFPKSGPPSLKLVPVLLDEHGAPQIAEGDLRENVLEEMSRLSEPLGFLLSGDSGSCHNVAPPLRESADAPAALPKKTDPRR